MKFMAVFTTGLADPLQRRKYLDTRYLRRKNTSVRPFRPVRKTSRAEKTMGKSSKWATSLVAVFAFYAAACTNPQEVSDIKAKVDEIQAQQKDILAKLDGLQKGQKNILAKAPAAPAAKPSRPQEDPNKVYKINVGNSYAKGPKDASVVIVEWSDFQ